MPIKRGTLFEKSTPFHKLENVIKSRGKGDIENKNTRGLFESEGNL